MLLSSRKPVPKLLSEIAPEMGVGVAVGVVAALAVAVRAIRLAAMAISHRIAPKELIREALIGSLLQPHLRCTSPSAAGSQIFAIGFDSKPGRDPLHLANPGRRDSRRQ